MAAADLLAVFDGLEDPSEPLTTDEVAVAADCAHRTASEALSNMAATGTVETKRIGNGVRVWWRPRTDLSSAVDGTGPSPDAATDPAFELTTDQVIELEFTSRRLAEPFLELGDEQMDLRIDGFVRLPDGSHTQYWTVEGISGETVLDLPRHFPTNEDVRLLKKEGDRYRVEVKGARSSLLSTYDDFGGRAVATVLEAGTIRNVVRFPATVDPMAVLRAIRSAVASDFELASQKLVYTPRLFSSLVEADLTERQWTVLQLAYYAGYFEVPREANGEELAERIELTRQTFNYHLRLAEARVLHHLFEPPVEDAGEDSNP